MRQCIVTFVALALAAMVSAEGQSCSQILAERKDTDKDRILLCELAEVAKVSEIAAVGLSEALMSALEEQGITDDTIQEVGKRKNDFLRFGKRKNDFLRFGKRKHEYLRFGKRKHEYLRFG